MKFHTTLGLRQTCCIIFMFTSMNTIAALNADCETVVQHGGWSCSEVTVCHQPQDTGCA